MLMTGVTSTSMNYTTNVDYKKWLGPDWKPRFDRVGIQVSNHQAWIDIMALLFFQFPSYVADSNVENLPGIGKIAHSAQCVFTKREGTKEDRIATLKNIE